MLGIAYSASIGSLGTLIGTPPNALLAGYMKESHDIVLGFGKWMIVGMPLAIIFLFVAWFMLITIFKREMDRKMIARGMPTIIHLPKPSTMS